MSEDWRNCIRALPLTPSTDAESVKACVEELIGAGLEDPIEDVRVASDRLSIFLCRYAKGETSAEQARNYIIDLSDNAAARAAMKTGETSAALARLVQQMETLVITRLLPLFTS